MPLTLVVEDGTGKADANTYASLADATAYHLAHVAGATWTAAASATQEAALAMATRLLDQGVTWKGYKEAEGNALEWPRVGVIDHNHFEIGSNEIPARLKNATCEFARWLVVGDRTADPEGIGFKRLKVDTLELEPDAADRGAVIPPVVAQMVEPYSSLVGGASFMVRMVRGG